jgi:hypothetical protein
VSYEPKLELLWWEGCPSTQRALVQLRVAAADVGLDPAGISLVQIRNEEEAARAGFRGSPTILIDGVDVAAAAGRAVPDPDDDEPTGLTCRVYRRRDGRFSPTPDPDDLRTALRQASLRQEVRR